MKAAIIDLGSNSFRLLLGTYIDGQWHNEPKRLWTTRLGNRDANGYLTEEAIQKGLDALRDIKEAVQAYGAEKVIGLATSAVREAPNGEEFMKEAVKVCPMEGRILTGEEEAYYGFRGAVGDYLGDEKHYALIDVGGGSTELALGDIHEVYWRRSYPVGAVRLQAIAEEGPQAVWEETRFLWDPMPIAGPFGEYIGIGGTITTLAAIHLKLHVYNPMKVQGHRLTREAIEGMVMELRYMTAEERSHVPGLPAGRADIIVAGAEIVTSFMDAYDIGYLVVSDSDGMEGMQAELVANKHV